MMRNLSLLALCCYYLACSAPLYAQAGDSSITYSVVKLEPCRYRLFVSNTSPNCFNQVTLLLQAGYYTGFTANGADGWVVEQLSPTELLLTHANGLFPVGFTRAVDFSFFEPGGTDPVLSVLYPNLCLMEGYFVDFPLEACPVCPCNPPNGLAASAIDTSRAVVTWSPDPCSQATWLNVVDGSGNSLQYIVPAQDSMLLLEGLIPGQSYLIYAFSECDGVLSAPSDTVSVSSICNPFCGGSLVTNGGFDSPSNTLPVQQDQIGLCPGWKSTINLSNSAEGDWYWGGVAGGYQVAYVNNGFWTYLKPPCPPRYAGFGMDYCEGITTKLSKRALRFQTCEIMFWWAVKEPITANTTFSIYLSNADMVSSTGPTGCQEKPVSQAFTEIKIPLTTSVQPYKWYLFYYKGTAAHNFDRITLASSNHVQINNYVYVDDICLQAYGPWICDNIPSIKRSTVNPGAFLGEIELDKNQELLSAVWDFGDGTRDSSCCLGSVLHDFMPGNYEVCLTATLIDSSGTICSSSTCTAVTISGAGDKCSKASAFLQKAAEDCCYQLITNATEPECFTKINLTLSSGSFANSEFDTGWSVQTNGNTAELKPASGQFIPAGQDLPAKICNPDGTEPYTLDVEFVYDTAVCRQTLEFACNPDLCSCQGFQNLAFTSTPDQPEIPAVCDNQQPVQLPCLGNDALYQLRGNLRCQGGDCAPELSYEIARLDGAILASGTSYGSVFTTSGFDFAPGEYQVRLTGVCGADSCSCTIRFTIPECFPCFSNEAAFLAAATQVQTNGTVGECKLDFQATGLNACMQIRYDWGDGSSSGPVGDNTPVSHTYAQPGLYAVCYTIEEVDSTGQIRSTYKSCEQVEAPCSCSCGTFYDVYVYTFLNNNYELFCGQTVAGNCNLPTYSLRIGWNFSCTGTCTTPPPVSWTLTGPSGTQSGTTTTYFINVLPINYTTPGLYTLTLTGYCNGQACPPCVYKFTLNCPNQCPCDQAVIQAQIAKGFKQINYPNSCQVCFSPYLSDCEEVEWFINNVSKGTFPGSATICHNFVSTGLYDIRMQVTSRKSDGSVCTTGSYSRTVFIRCKGLPPCNDVIVGNPRFAAGAVAGGLNSGGASAGWQGVSGDPVMVFEPDSMDQWSVQLRGNADTSDVLSTLEPVCIEKDTGTIRLRFSGPPQNVILGGKVNGRLWVQLFRGPEFKPGLWPDDVAYVVGSIDLEPLDTTAISWEAEIPYNLSDWAAEDGCGDPDPATGRISVRPAVYLTNFSRDILTELRLNQFCFGGALVDLEPEPFRKKPVRILPNPNAGTCTLELAEAAAPGSTVRVIDYTGKTVWETALPQGSQKQLLQLEFLPGGLYHIQIRSAGKAPLTGRFIKH